MKWTLQRIALRDLHLATLPVKDWESLAKRLEGVWQYVFRSSRESSLQKKDWNQIVCSLKPSTGQFVFWWSDDEEQRGHLGTLVITKVPWIEASCHELEEASFKSKHDALIRNMRQAVRHGLSGEKATAGLAALRKDRAIAVICMKYDDLASAKRIVVRT